MNTQHTDAGRIDPDDYERSPSVGSEETAIVLDARDGYDHTQPDECSLLIEVFL